MCGGTIPLPVPTSPDVLVIGGGVAGLCAAVDLSSRGWSVMLAEEKQHLGGRVYSFVDDKTGDDIDNGQHLMLGCYHSTLRFLRTVRTDKFLSIQDSLAIRFRSRSDSFVMRAPALPAPLHMLGALASLKSLPLRDRIALLRIVPTLLSNSARTSERLRSMTVDGWLTATRQSDAAKKYLWNILAVGTLNEMPEQAGADAFVTVLRRIFLGAPRDASIALPRRGLSRLFGDGAAAYIEAHGGCVRLHAPAGAITIGGGAALSAVVGGETIRPRAIVSAVPYHALPRLFAEGAHDAVPALCDTGRFAAVPIVSIHLWFDTHFMSEEFSALLDSPIDWVFNKSAIVSGLDSGEARQRPGAPMYLSLVVSAARELAALPKEEIVRRAVEEVKRYFPGAENAALVHWLVVKEKRATFSPQLGIDAFRPAHQTNIRNLFLGGDWTGTHLPATIEGAAQSGYACAEAAHAYLSSALEGKQ
jgi:hydroxysqualene dehydroxylase